MEKRSKVMSIIDIEKVRAWKVSLEKQIAKVNEKLLTLELENPEKLYGHLIGKAYKTGAQSYVDVIKFIPPGEGLYKEDIVQVREIYLGGIPYTNIALKNIKRQRASNFSRQRGNSTGNL